jgi:serine/threonine protein kinase/tetratricopeptide (TPR) repeat protein
MTTNDTEKNELLAAATDTPAMMLVDQKRRWLHGERVLVEEYCRQFPSLQHDTESLLDLIYSEVLLRERRGEQPTLAEYVERFPDLADQLRLQFELDQVVDSAKTMTEGSGTTIGRYTLLEKIGEGGMGVVYVAQQERPVTRQVALKIIKPGMDTQEVITRFEAERQALALMEHSNIARVFDAGATQSGRPYFVMELVRGTPITEYCDDHNLTIAERLRLFLQVCHAVQHAHQKGIIHRDLKPSNVLISQHDGQSVPKIIDFGLAKATGPQLTEKTLLTVYPQMMGTPLYMSPEQAELASLDIDTRADIYSLGALLYELLTGTTPFDPAQFRSIGLDELRRIIREEEPSRPSSRIKMLGDEGAIAASCRGTDLRRLYQLVDGDLDWIVMRCLEKDRKRRYGTASALALDIERYLHDEPVEACPPTRAYRLRKFVRRNKAGVLAGSAIAALLVSAIVILAVSNARIRRESDARAKALGARESSLAITTETVRRIAQLVTQLNYRVTELPGGPEVYKSVPKELLKYLEQILKQAEADDQSKDEVFVILEQIADVQMGLLLTDARETYQRAVDIAQQRLDADPDNPDYLADLGRAERSMLEVMQGQLSSGSLAAKEEAELIAYCNDLLADRRGFNRRHPDNLQPLAVYYWTLGKYAVEQLGDTVTAERLFRDSVATSEEYLRKKPSDTVEQITASKNAIWLGRLLQNSPVAGPADALPYFELGHGWAKNAMNDDPKTRSRATAAIAELEMGICQFQVRPSERAISLVKHAAAELRRHSVHFPDVLPQSRSRADVPLYQARRAHAALVRQLLRLGRTVEAEDAARQMSEWLVEISPRVSRNDSLQKELQLAQTENIELLLATGQLSEAVKACRQHISFWKEIQRYMPQADAKPFLAGGYLTLIRVLTEMHEVDEAHQAAAEADRLGLNSPQTLALLARNLVMALHLEPLPIAWRIGPDVPALAVEAAQKAVDASPDDGFYWNTLGAAQYCAGEWRSAIYALEESMDLRNSGDPSDWLFLAMSHWQLDQHEQARTFYDKAITWIDQNQSASDELLRLRAVATGVIGTSNASLTSDAR